MNSGEYLETEVSMEKSSLSNRIRKIILEQSKRANVGHIGSALSIVDIVVALYAHVFHFSDPTDPERDRFILSKGHAVLALYAIFFTKDWITETELNTYCGDNSLLGSHPEHTLRGIDFSTGSLGMGLSFGAGAALAARLQTSTRRVFVLVSDAECNEGSIWESIMFAAHHRLGNLIAIVDLNGQQALGYTDHVLSLSPLAERWRAFNWDVHEVNGHDIEAITQVIESLDTTAGKPHVLIAHTTFGKGISYMENQIKWHYLPVSEIEYVQGLKEIEAEI
jgi:transketolase